MGVSVVDKQRAKRLKQGGGGGGWRRSSLPPKDTIEGSLPQGGDICPQTCPPRAPDRAQFHPNSSLGDTLSFQGHGYPCTWAGAAVFTCVCLGEGFLRGAGYPELDGQFNGLFCKNGLTPVLGHALRRWQG